MFSLIHYNYGREPRIATFENYPTLEEIKPHIEKLGRLDDAQFLLDNTSLTLGICQWLKIKEEPGNVPT